MRLERCPKCNAKVAPADTQCLDCGEDLLAHMDELRKGSTEKRELTDQEKRERAVAVAAAAARGHAFGVERSEETRIRTFDKHAAETTKGEIGAAWGTAAIALVIGIIALKVGFDALKLVGGVAGFKGFSLALLREWGFGMLAQPKIHAMAGVGAGLGCILCFAGQTWRAILAHQSVAAVARGEKPTIVFITPPTRLGLYLIALAVPPAGLLFGLMLNMLGRDEDTKALGSMMLILAGIVLVVLALNMLWSLAGGIKTPAPAPGEADEADETAGLIRNAVALARALC